MKHITCLVLIINNISNANKDDHQRSEDLIFSARTKNVAAVSFYLPVYLSIYVSISIYLYIYILQIL